MTRVTSSPLILTLLIYITLLISAEYLSSQHEENDGIFCASLQLFGPAELAHFIRKRECYS